jgi:hypothetical protein
VTERHPYSPGDGADWRAAAAYRLLWQMTDRTMKGAFSTVTPSNIVDAKRGASVMIPTTKQRPAKACNRRSAWRRCRQHGQPLPSRAAQTLYPSTAGRPPSSWSSTPAARQRRSTVAALLALAIATVGIALSGTTSTANAAAPEQVSGTAYYQTAADDPCGPPPPGFENFDSYPALVLSGSLQGCWYTMVETARQTPSGAYLESGQEIFVGTLDGGPAGTFVTSYRFEAKLAPDGTEIRGRCQHPIIHGSGAFQNATGLILFKDAPPNYFYRGHIRLA